MAKLAEGSHGGESDEEAAKLIEGIMSQLMTKEILYEPLKELHAKVLTRHFNSSPSPADIAHSSLGT